jgi:signal recognition particle receptor subunit beta
MDFVRSPDPMVGPAVGAGVGQHRAEGHVYGHRLPGGHGRPPADGPGPYPGPADVPSPPGHAAPPGTRGRAVPPTTTSLSSRPGLVDPAVADPSVVDPVMAGLVRMGEARRSGAPARPTGAPPIPVKIVVAGGFGVGKTTTVNAISEIEPLTTEAEMTAAGLGVDDPGYFTAKTSTTVAMDFGCVTIDDSLKLYLFGTPGQERFGFMWDDLSRGALGALVVVDSARLDECYPAVDYFERAALPFVVAVNAFHGRLAHDLPAIRWALAIGDHVPVVRFDARDRLSVRDALLVVLDRALDRAIRQRSR